MRFPVRQTHDAQQASSSASVPAPGGPSADDGELIPALRAEPAPARNRPPRLRRVLHPVRARPWLSALVVLVLIAAGAGLFWWTGRGSTATAASSYRLVSASVGTVRQTVSSTGTIEPAVQEALNFAVSGRVTSVPAQVGQPVTAGTVLATVDSATVKANLAQAEASLASAQARLSADSGGSSTQLAADSAAVTAEQGQVASAQAALADAELTSPIAGVVAAVNLTVGQQVGGSSGTSGSSAPSGTSSGNGSGGNGVGGTGGNGASTGAGATAGSTAQVLVISNNSWIVDASVDDTQVGLLAVGDQAQVTGATASGVVYGTVTSIGLIASSTSGVASFPVVIKVTGDPAGLHAGATATVTMIYRQLSDVLTVPSAAMHQVGGKTVVYQLSGGKQVAQPVTVGVSAGGIAQITAGLTEGSQVVVAVPRATGNRPGGNTNNTGRTGFGRTGGFGGGGFGGGGGGFGGGGSGFGGGAGRSGGTGGG